MSPLSVTLSEVGKLLNDSGSEVIWCLESRIPELKYKLNLKGNKIYFSDYLKSISKSKICLTDKIKCGFCNYDRDFELNILRKDKYYYSGVINDLDVFFKEKITIANGDIIIYENVSNTFSYVALEVAKEVGAKFLGIIGSRLPGRIELWESEFGVGDLILDKFKGRNFLSEKSLVYAKNYLNNFCSVQPDYMKNNPTFYKSSLLMNIFMKKSYLLRYVVASILSIFLENNNFQSHGVAKDILIRLKRNMIRKIRIYFLSSHFDETKEDDVYYFYPLHYHPESSTSVLAPHYVDEDVVVKNISFSIPAGRVLYVKDHPNAFGYKSLSFYKKIKSLPNVKLINPDFDSKKLIANSVAVITVTSTAGYEAILMGKQAFVLGDVFYLSHQKAVKINSYKHLYDELRKVNFIKFDDYEYNLRYVASYYMSTYNGSVILNRTDDNFKKSVDSIYSAVLAHIKLC